MSARIDVHNTGAADTLADCGCDGRFYAEWAAPVGTAIGLDPTLEPKGIR